MTTRRVPRVGLTGSPALRHTAAERLWARTVKQPNGCWEVQGAAVHSGHVQIKRKAEKLPALRAHRLAWELLRGPVPAGLSVLHRCDNPRCVNPDHLFLGTQRDNILDSICKGRYNAFGRQKLNAAQVREIRALYAAGVLQKDIARQFGIKRHSVSGIVTGKSWTHLDPPFAASAGSSPAPVDRGQAAFNALFERVPHVELPVIGEVA